MLVIALLCVLFFFDVLWKTRVCVGSLGCCVESVPFSLPVCVCVGMSESLFVEGVWCQELTAIAVTALCASLALCLSRAHSRV